MRFFRRSSVQDDVKYDLGHDEWRTLAAMPFWVFAGMVVEDLMGVVGPSDDDLQVLAETVEDMANVRNPLLSAVGQWLQANQEEISAVSSKVDWREGLTATRSVLQKVSDRDALVFDGYILYVATAFADRPPKDAIPLRGKRKMRASSIVALLDLKAQAASRALESAGWSR